LTLACRLCAEPLRHLVADLGTTPLANAYLRPEQLTGPETYFPLRLFFCDRCLLLQLQAVVAPDALFSEYLYFSSYSETLLAASRRFADSAIDRFGLKADGCVIEIASNDGYLLRHFAARGVDVLGIEPAANIARAAEASGIPTVVRFFGTRVAQELADAGTRARLLIANNVVAHVPDPKDFIAGLRLLLAPGGTASVEFHHALHLVHGLQFDNIYHEHFQYWSLAAAQRAFAAAGMTIVDVDEIPAQGGSLRVYAQHAEDAGAPDRRVTTILTREAATGLFEASGYARLAEDITTIKLGLLDFLVDARRAGRSVVCYGAAAKGNTLLNCCGVRGDLIDYAVDRSPHKQNHYLPGSRIPIAHPDRIRETKPDFLLILPWNLTEEIVAQMSHIREWGGRFVVAVPSLKIIE
jgi:SAM-dependent methyltransferase